MTAFFSSAPQLKRDPLGGKRGNMEDLLRTIRRTITIGSLGLAGCNWFGSGVQVDMATTSVTRPRPDSMVSVSYRVTNRGSTSTYLLACDHRPDAETDRLVASGWQEYLGTGCLAIYDMSPLILAPGQAVDATWSWDVAGAYRLRVFLGDGPNAAATSSVIGPMFVVR